jgi:hypothetical protein
VDYEPCIIYEKKGIKRWVPHIIVWKVLEGMKERDLV